MCTTGGSCFPCCRETHPAGGQPDPSECSKVGAAKNFYLKSFDAFVTSIKNSLQHMMIGEDRDNYKEWYEFGQKIL